MTLRIVAIRSGLRKARVKDSIGALQQLLDAADGDAEIVGNGALRALLDTVEPQDGGHPFWHVGDHGLDHPQLALRDKGAFGIGAIVCARLRIEPCGVTRRTPCTGDAAIGREIVGDTVEEGGRLRDGTIADLVDTHPQILQRILRIVTIVEARDKQARQRRPLFEEDRA